MKMKWSIDQLYFYLVCFVMLIVIIVGVSTLVRAGIDLLIPYPDSRWDNPAPVPGWEYKEGIPGGDSRSQLPADVIERELQEQDTFMAERSRKNSLNEAILSIFRGIAMLLVAFPVYIYHWRKIPILT
jgi:hypothetical protein